MARNIQNFGGAIIGSQGQVFQIETKNELLMDNKFFAAAVMCGHAGNGFFVPVIISVNAKDKESAIDIIKASPRVKNKCPRCILSISEISLAEFNLIRYINKYDGYISHTNRPLEIRKIVTPNYAEALMKKNRGEKLNSKERIMLNEIQDKTIRYAEDYPDSYILQKTFAPSCFGNKIVYPSKVNMDKLLYEYYKNRIQFLGINNKKVPILKSCLKIFGPENEFGVKLDADNNTIFFNDQSEAVENFEITEKSKENILIHQEYRLRDAINKFKKTSAVETVPESKKPLNLSSAIDKFNRKLNKTKQIQAAKDKEKAD